MSRALPFQRVQGSDCRVAAGEGNGGIAFNGITLSPDKRRLLVADTKSIVVFDITGPGSLRRAQLLPLPHFIDNIEVRGWADRQISHVFILFQVSM